ncbi:LOW QUALITY PROTEIN: uncharacterized protein [Procambarus clarkii]|uniref:LOW QUALITY PROTEIN: uncharacterized protein n=1 Tax=Procambarus clarkii TaxID=6728 RepID=UPI001E675592|nr:uncharacterized protein LOC123771738 [Procambarus clarkii]
MADTLSNNFCSLCGYSFDRFGSDKLNIRTSLASPVVEQSGLLEMLDITVAPLRKELVFICYSCRTVFSNYTTAKTNFKNREMEALKLLTEPVEANEQGQLPFVPYLKRKCMHRPNSELMLTRPSKIQKIDSCATDSKSTTEQGQSPEKEPKALPRKEVLDDLKSINSSNERNSEAGIGTSKPGALRFEAVKFLEDGRYRASVRKLWGRSKRFRTSCLSFLSVVIKRETRNLLKHGTLFTKKLDGNSLRDVSWGPTIDTVAQVAPTTFYILFALLGLDVRKASQEAKDAKQNLAGCMLSMALYKRYKRRANFLPLLHSVYLHNIGTPLEVIRVLHQVGLTVPAFKLPGVFKLISSSNSEIAQLWKKELELALEIVHRKPEATPKKYYAERRKQRSVLPKPTPVTSYGLCWDSIQYPVHSSKGQKKNPKPLMAQAYAVKNRVPFMMTYKDAEVRLADNISYEEFVPDSEDFVRVREQMKKEVQKVLVQYYNIFKNLDVVEQHQYSSITIQKSEIVDCGAVFRSPADNGSVATLMKDLKRYMAYDEGEPIPLCIFGGQDAVEKMVSAKDVMSCFSEKLDRLDGLEPAITDFGRQILLAKDIIKTFFPSGMSREFGSLHHLCEFEKTLLKKCEESDFNAICTILKLVTHSYIVALAENKLLSTANKNQLHADEKQRILEKISEEIVADIWPNVDGSSLDIVRQGNEPVRDGECSFGDCVNFRDKARLPCSERCGRPFYFCCKKPLNNGLVECAKRENCPQGAWFHLNKKCSGLVEAPEDDWLCSTCALKRRLASIPEKKDGLWEYHRGLLWYSLFFWVGHSAEQQGNGWLLHAVWKVSMPLFESRGYSDYLRQGYAFLSGVAGRIPRLAAHDTVHNRTVNVKGGANNNMSWDRAVELFNRELLRQPALKSQRKTSTASNKAIGCWIQSINRAWEKEICNGPDMKEKDRTKIVQEYVSFMNSRSVLQKVPGRRPYKDIDYAHVICIQNPSGFIDKLKELSEKDVSRQMNERESDVLE